MSSTTRIRTIGMTASPSRGSRAESQLLARRIVIVIGLGSIAAIHVLDLPGKLKETPYLGFAYMALIVAALVVAERLVTTATRLDFAAAGLLSAMVIVGFVIDRTVGMPGAMDDIDNWLEPLGLLSLVVEGFVLWQCVAVLFADVPPHPRDSR